MHNSDNDDTFDTQLSAETEGNLKLEDQPKAENDSNPLIAMNEKFENETNESDHENLKWQVKPIKMTGKNWILFGA